MLYEDILLKTIVWNAMIQFEVDSCSLKSFLLNRGFYFHNLKATFLNSYFQFL